MAHPSLKGGKKDMVCQGRQHLEPAAHRKGAAREIEIIAQGVGAYLFGSSRSDASCEHLGHILCLSYYLTDPAGNPAGRVADVRSMYV